MPVDHDGHATSFGGGEHDVVALGPAGVDHGGASGVGRNLECIGEREERVRARTAPLARSPALRVAIHDESTLDIWPAPTPTVAPSFTRTIVFDFTRHAIVHASARSLHSASVGSGSRPPSTRRGSRSPGLDPAPARRRAAVARRVRCRRAQAPPRPEGSGVRRKPALAAAENDGAITTSVNTSAIAADGIGIDLVAERHDAPERAHGVTFERGEVRRRGRAARCDTTRIVVFDDHR